MRRVAALVGMLLFLAACGTSSQRPFALATAEIVSGGGGSAPTSTLQAPEAGTITLAEFNENTGNTVRIENDAKTRWYVYSHLEIISVSLGQTVLKGQEVGKTGNTGAVTCGT